MENSIAAPAVQGRRGGRKGRDLLLKLRFREWLDTDDGLLVTDLRVAGRMLSAYNPTTDRVEKLSYDMIAADLHLGRRTVINAVERLVGRGKFTILRHGGRNRTNEYRPNLEAIPEGCAYAAGHIVHQQKGCISEHKRVHQLVHSDGASASALPSVSSVKKDTTVLLPQHRAGIHGAYTVQPQDEDALKDEVNHVIPSVQDEDISDRVKVCEFIRLTEEAIENGTYRPHPDTSHMFDMICEVWDSHTGDPIGGWAYRVGDMAAAYLPEPGPEPQPPIDPPPRKRIPAENTMSAAEFEERRAQIIRELEAEMMNDRAMPRARRNGAGGHP